MALKIHKGLYRWGGGRFRLRAPRTPGGEPDEHRCRRASSCAASASRTPRARADTSPSGAERATAAVAADNPTQPLFPELTDRERDVLRLVAEGQNNPTIARDPPPRPKDRGEPRLQHLDQLHFADRAEAIATATLDTYADAYCAKDVGGLMALFDPGDDVSVIGTGADELCTSQAEIRRLFERNFAEATADRFDWHWRHVTRRGDTATVAASLTIPTRPRLGARRCHDRGQ